MVYLRASVRRVEAEVGDAADESTHCSHVGRSGGALGAVTVASEVVCPLLVVDYDLAADLHRARRLVYM